jgi:hypothetical protein
MDAALLVATVGNTETRLALSLGAVTAVNAGRYSRSKPTSSNTYTVARLTNTGGVKWLRA